MQNGDTDQIVCCAIYTIFGNGNFTSGNIMAFVRIINLNSELWVIYKHTGVAVLFARFHKRFLRSSQNIAIIM